jgi:hypothetical protein
MKKRSLAFAMAVVFALSVAIPLLVSASSEYDDAATHCCTSFSVADVQALIEEVGIEALSSSCFTCGRSVSIGSRSWIGEPAWTSHSWGFLFLRTCENWAVLTGQWRSCGGNHFCANGYINLDTQTWGHTACGR